MKLSTQTNGLLVNDMTPADAAGKSTAEQVRVLHVNSGNLYGGVETILVNFARLRSYCPAMESEFAVCHPGRLSQELRAAGVSVHMVGGVRLSRPWTVWKARRKLREILRRERFQVVICHMPWSLAVFGGVVQSEGQRLGFWAHGFHTGRGWLERLASWTKPDLAIANSAFTENGLANLFPTVPHRVVYAPMALTVSPQREQWRSAVREQEGIGTDTVVILQVSRMESWKGHVLHLRALSQLRTTQPWTCWIAGGPQGSEEEQYFGKLKELAKQLGIGERVRFLGQRSDIPQLLAAADIFCQPNQAPEPFGIVFIEALWAGRPVVTTALGGALEIVDDTCGLMVEPDAATLAAALGRLIESSELRARLGQAGPARATSICDPAAQMNKLMELLRKTNAVEGANS